MRKKQITSFIISCFIVLCTTLPSCSHKTTPGKADYTSQDTELTAWQKGQNELFKDPIKSPLKPEIIANFQGLDFYPYDKKFKVSAKLFKTPEAPTFDMMTTSGRVKKYRQYGILQFRLENQDIQLNVYQSQDLRDSEEFRKHLFLPFYDATSGLGSYAGGRYINLIIPKGDTVSIDFNKAYNPYCAYNDGYSCPITPTDNNLKDIKVLAGTKDYDK